MWSALGRWVLQRNRPHCAERSNGLANRRRRSGSSTPGQVRPEGTAPLKSEVTSAETAPARTLQHTGTSGRGGPVLASVPAGTVAASGRHGNHRRLPARHGQRRQRVCRGFWVLVFLGEAAGGSLPVLPGLAPAPVGWCCCCCLYSPPSSPGENSENGEIGRGH